MLIYPETPEIQRPFMWETEFKTLITNFETSVEQRRQQWRFQRRNTQLKYETLQRGELDILWNFYVSRKGSLNSFIFIEPDLPPYNSYTDEYAGRGNGSTILFAIPARSASNVIAYVNGISTSITLIPYNSGSGGVGLVSGDIGFQDGDIGWLATGGTGSLTDTDMIQFATPPGSGALITVDFTGRLAIKSRFTQDKLNREMFQFHLYNTGLGIIEVKAA